MFVLAIPPRAAGAAARRPEIERGRLIYVRVCIYIYIYIYMCVQALQPAGQHSSVVRRQKAPYIYMLYIYIYIYMYIYTYICIHIYIYIYIYDRRRRAS